MARVRREERVVTGGVPVELTSMFHPAWRSAGEVSRLVTAWALPLSTHPGWEWFEAFDAVLGAWCRANGFMHPVWTHNIDHRRARAAGLDVVSVSSRYRLRPGVEFMPDDGPIRHENLHALGPLIIRGRWDHPDNRRTGE